MIDASPYEFVVPMALGFLIVVLSVAFLAGMAIILREAAIRPHQPWL
jgi:hypothetical protein